MEKHQDMEGEGKQAKGTNTGGGPGYQSQSKNLETHLVRKCSRDIKHQWAVCPGNDTTIMQLNKYNI